MRLIVPLASLLLCAAAPEALADEAAQQAGPALRAEGTAAVHPARSKPKRGPRAPAALPIAGPAGPEAPVRAARRGQEGGGWTIAPTWNASSGATGAAYGSRALIDELKHTPGETSGYGGGAKLGVQF